MTAVLFSTLLFLASFLAASKNYYKNIHIKSYRCNMSEKFIHKNFSCYARSWSRNFSTANAYFRTKMPLYNITVSYVSFRCNFFLTKVRTFNQAYSIAYFKYGTIYRPVMGTPTVNVCKFSAWLTNNKNAPNNAVVFLIRSIDASFPGLIHKCPYNVRNTQITFTSTYLDFLGYRF